MEREPALEVTLPAFEGPLDLLLHLVREEKINIYDIPVARITQRYLETIDGMQSLNLSLAGDFLVMAATLLHIKSKMLLPRHTQQGEEEALGEGDDPRQELVARLLEYQRFKDATEIFESREAIWRRIFSRNPAASEKIYLGDLAPSDLLMALQRVMASRPDQERFFIEPDEFSVRDQIDFILSRMARENDLLFDQLFEGITTRRAVVMTFLALLEMVRLGLVQILQATNSGPIRLMGKDKINRNSCPPAPR